MSHTARALALSVLLFGHGCAAPGPSVDSDSPSRLAEASFHQDGSEDFEPLRLPRIDTSGAPNGVVPLPAGLPRELRRTFEKVTKLTAPNGGDIHLFAQTGVSDAQLVRAREVMRFYLTDAPGTLHGGDKAQVANSMADLGATLVMFDDERSAERAFRGALGELELFFQDLYATESVVEGSAAYLDNSVRDATLEEVFHLVQGAGIEPALPALRAQIEAATDHAIARELWFTNEEWEAEGSSPFEYIISVIDVLYGFWSHDPDGNGESFHGEYVLCTPEAARARDPRGVEAMRAFLPETFDLDVTVDPSFEGDFVMERRAGLPYTRKSMHLTRARLSGARDAGLVGNARDNRLQGNAGDNHLRGGAGRDTAVFLGERDEYDVRELEGGRRVVVDSVEGRDGTDTLEGIEALEFLGRRWSGERAAGADVETAVETGGKERAELSLFELLDTDSDGAVSRFEGLDGWLSLVDGADADGDGSLGAAELEDFLAEEISGRQAELEEVFADFDGDGDGQLRQRELPGDLAPLLPRLDQDASGALSPRELERILWSGTALVVEMELAALLEEFDERGAGSITLRGLPEDAASFLRPMDVDGDGLVTEDEARAWAEAEVSGARFEVEGTRAHMNGTIGPTTPGRVLELLLLHPEVDTIVLHDVPGSLDDEANLRAATWIHRHGIATHLTADSEIASGGTDFFLAGVRRTADGGARIGVHSWAGPGESGADLPRDHDEHERYLEFYRAVDIDEAFYWYTLEAAPPQDIHWMTSEELERFDVLNGG